MASRGSQIPNLALGLLSDQAAQPNPTFQVRMPSLLIPGGGLTRCRASRSRKVSHMIPNVKLSATAGSVQELQGSDLQPDLAIVLSEHL